MRRLVAGLLGCAFLAPGAAHAWTDAEVTRVAADVALDRELHARVTLVLSVRVHGGWLEALDLEGLDPDLVLDESKPPWAIDGEGQKRFPEVRARGEGRIQLSFGRRDNPRRGTLEVGLVYTTVLAGRSTLAPSDGLVRVRWALPAWRSGLDNVTITVSGPPGTVPAPPDDAEESSTRGSIEPRDGASVVVFHRVHLPRTMVFAVAVDVPEASIAEALRAPPTPASIGAERATPTLARPAPRPPDPAPLVALVLAVVIVLARDRFARASRARGAEARPLVPAPAWIAVPLALALAGAVAWAGPEQPGLELAAIAAIALLGVFRPSVVRGALPRLGALRRASPLDRRAARRAVLRERLGLTLLLDATTPLGLATLGLLGGSTVILSGMTLHEATPEMAALVLLVVPFVSATRHALPRDAASRLCQLEPLARHLALPPAVALDLVVRVAPDGELLEPRLALVLEPRPSHLDRLDIVLGSARDSGGHRLVPMLVVGTREGSDAELAAAGVLAGASVARAPGGKHARAVVIDARTRGVVAALLEALQAVPGPAVRADCEAA